jgi:hypothetical protein
MACASVRGWSVAANGAKEVSEGAPKRSNWANWTLDEWKPAVILVTERVDLGRVGSQRLRLEAGERVDDGKC